MSLLDTIIESASGPAVLREDHDTKNIFTDQSDPTGVQRQIAAIRAGRWDEQEYGLSADAQIAILEAADTPEKREAAVADLQRRALQRASLDVTGGRVSVMVAGELPWHRLGVQIAEATTSEHAARLANLNWQVLKVPTTYQWKNQTRVSPETWLTVRDDTGTQLGTVGSRYQPIQNADGFAFLDAVLAEYGARYETAGAIHGGRKVWMQVQLPRLSFDVIPGDQIDAYAIFILEHTGAEADRCLATTQRVVCANTLRLAADGRKGISIRHTGAIRDKIETAKRALGLATRQFAGFRESARAMVAAPLELQPYANDVLDAVLEVTQAEAQAGADVLAASLAKTEANRELVRVTLQRQVEQRATILDDIVERYESDRCRPKGSAWAAFNAITEHADHGRIRRQTGAPEARLSRRFESILTGEADAMKQMAYQKAVEAI